jgi:hypothetical protein
MPRRVFRGPGRIEAYPFAFRLFYREINGLARERARNAQAKAGPHDCLRPLFGAFSKLYADLCVE